MKALKSSKVTILGYGNQGRAQALNLKDSGIEVRVGARRGAGWEAAVTDRLEVMDIPQAIAWAEVVVWLIADHAIPAVYREVAPKLKGRTIGFSHGFALQFGKIPLDPEAAYFLVSPKGAGVWLRKNYQDKTYLPGVYAVGPTAASELARPLVLEYAAAIGVSQKYLLETTFQEEVECDLFGEQVVLCGGIPQLIERAFETLVSHGHSPEMAFFECCYEAKLILDLLMEYGPQGMADRISPTAFYGGRATGRRIIDETKVQELQRIFGEIRSGEFAKRWLEEANQGMPHVKQWREYIAQSGLQRAYEKLKDAIH